LLGRALLRHDSALTVHTLYRSVLGRPPVADEQAAMAQRLADAVPVDELIEELLSSEEGVERTIARSRAAFRAKLQNHFSADDRKVTPRLVFLHIMKVGGTSLSDTFQRWVPADRARVHVYMDDLVLTPKPLLAQLRIIAGHIPFGALRLIPRPYATLCVLREPVSRTLSHYSHLRTVDARYHDLTLDEFITNDEFDVPSSNYQARQLAHDLDVKEAWRSYSPEHLYRARGGDPNHPYPLQSLFDSVSVAFDDDELMRIASDHLAQINYVGVTEALDGVGAALAGLFGVVADDIPRLNASPPIEPGQIDGRIRRRIEARTEVDRALYDQARSRARQ
jgi:hypothetical protein